MDKFELDKLIKKIKTKMDNDRYNHTVGVAYTAASLAMCHGRNETEGFIDKALIAGFLHDNAKCISSDELLKKCDEFNIPITASEKNNPFLLHGKLGAYYAKTEFGITDNDIINAITWHTTGRPEMSLLEKIIFVSDYIEPGRFKQKNLKNLRELAFTDLDKCVYEIAKDTIEYIIEQNKELDIMTLKTRDYYFS